MVFHSLIKHDKFDMKKYVKNDLKFCENFTPNRAYFEAKKGCNLEVKPAFPL